MTTKGNQKLTYVLAFLLLAGGLGYLIYAGLGENSVYFLNVSEALAMEQEELSKARLFGTVGEDDLAYHSDSLGVRFSLLDKQDAGKTMVVDYSGAVPDTFKPGVEVIVEGGMDPGKGLFQAKTLMTKCPSKYEKQSSQQG